MNTLNTFTFQSFMPMDPLQLRTLHNSKIIMSGFVISHIPVDVSNRKGRTTYNKKNTEKKKKNELNAMRQTRVTALNGLLWLQPTACKWKRKNEEWDKQQTKKWKELKPMWSEWKHNVPSKWIEPKFLH